MQIGSLEDTAASMVSALAEADVVAGENRELIASELQAVLKKVWKRPGRRPPPPGV